MTGAVLANIYLGKITKWDDPAIKALNPKVSLPSTRITPVYRSDNSGTTYNFTDYLSAVSPAWKSKIGVGVNANWPAGQGGQGSSGVAGVVSNTQGALGYVDIAYALKNQLKFMSIRNNSGKYTTPGLRGISRGRVDRQDGAGDQRAAHRQPAEGRPARLPDLHVHLRDPADEDRQGGRAAHASSSTPSTRPRARSSGRSCSSRRCRRSCSSPPRRR